MDFIKEVLEWGFDDSTFDSSLLQNVVLGVLAVYVPFIIGLGTRFFKFIGSGDSSEILIFQIIIEEIKLKEIVLSSLVLLFLLSFELNVFAFISLFYFLWIVFFPLKRTFEYLLGNSVPEEKEGKLLKGYDLDHNRDFLFRFYNSIWLRRELGNREEILVDCMVEHFEEAYKRKDYNFIVESLVCFTTNIDFRFDSSPLKLVPFLLRVNFDLLDKTDDSFFALNYVVSDMFLRVVFKEEKFLGNRELVELIDDFISDIWLEDSVRTEKFIKKYLREYFEIRLKNLSSTSFSSSLTLDKENVYGNSKSIEIVNTIFCDFLKNPNFKKYNSYGLNYLDFNKLTGYWLKHDYLYALSLLNCPNESEYDILNSDIWDFLIIRNLTLPCVNTSMANGVLMQLDYINNTFEYFYRFIDIKYIEERIKNLELLKKEVTGVELERLHQLMYLLLDFKSFLAKKTD